MTTLLSGSATSHFYAVRKDVTTSTFDVQGEIVIFFIKKTAPNLKLFYRPFH